MGGKDYFLAKHFDKDRDGKLNEKESQNAYEEIRNGYEDKFFWNLDKEGANRQTRILQKRGEIVDAEDFSVLTKTYPKHPMSERLPTFKTKVELETARKKNTV